MLNYNFFNGVLNNRTIYDFIKKLDYDIQDVGSRLDIVRDSLYDGDGRLSDFFVEYFNQSDTGRGYFNVSLNKQDSTSDKDFICSQLEKISNYILFGEEAKEINRHSEYPYMTNNKCRTIGKREVKVDSTKEIDVSADEAVNVCNYKKISKITVNKNDLNEIQELRQLQDVIDYYSDKERLKNATEREKAIYGRIISSMRDNQRFVKTMIKRPIFFKQPLCDTTEYDMDRIDFANPKHILALLSNYANLKQTSYSDLNSCTKYIIMDFENLIKNTNLHSYERDIITYKIDGLKNNEIVKIINNKYNMSLTDSGLSRLYNSTIPKKISQQYMREYNDWYYIEVDKGTYKTCSMCNEVKLVSEFSQKKDSRDGLQNFCKDCDIKRKK